MSVTIFRRASGRLFAVMVVCLLGAETVLSQSLEPPTTGEVIGGQIGDVFRAIRQAEIALEEIRIAKEELNETIREARHDYFSCLRGCDEPEKVTANFLSRLAEKDYYYFTRRAVAEAASAVDQGLGLGASGGARGAVGQISGLGGGPLDNGLIRGCSEDFKTWALGVYEDVVNGSNFETASQTESNRAAYQRYVACRDRQEFARQTVDQATCPRAPIENPERAELIPGLMNETLVPGCGEPVGAGDTVFVHYTVWVLDQTAPTTLGQRVLATRRSGKPYEIALGTDQVFDYMEYGIRGMKVGEARKLIAVPDLGYGERGFEPLNIPPNATLVMDVELVSIGVHPLEQSEDEPDSSALPAGSDADATYVSFDYDFEAQKISCRYSNGDVVTAAIRMGCPNTLEGARHPLRQALEERVNFISQFFDETESAFHCTYTDGVVRVIRRQCWGTWDEQTKQTVIAGDSTGPYLVREYPDPDADTPWLLNQEKNSADGMYHCLYTDGVVRVVRGNCRGGRWDAPAKEWAASPLYGLPRFIREYEYGADPEAL